MAHATGVAEKPRAHGALRGATHLTQPLWPSRRSSPAARPTQVRSEYASARAIQYSRHATQCTCTM